MKKKKILCPRTPSFGEFGTTFVSVQLLLRPVGFGEADVVLMENGLWVARSCYGGGRRAQKSF